MALDKVTTAVITDDSVTGAKIENNPTVAGNLTVAGTSTLTGNATASGNLTVTGDIVPSTPLSHRNMIINGGMQVWQRGTAAIETGGGGLKTVDRFRFSEEADGEYTSEKHSMTLAELNTTGHSTALKLVCTTADTSIAVTQHASFWQPVEAQNLQHLQYGTANAKTMTLSFWVKSNKTGTYTIVIKKVDSTTYYCPIEYTISSADTWEQKKITITPTAGSTSLITGAGGIIPNDNGEGMQVRFNLAWGSNYHGTNNTWTTSAHYSTSSQVNWLDSTSNNFYITGVQLELGSSATPFEHRSYGEELARCERYYWRWTSAAYPYGAFCMGQGYSSTEVNGVRYFPTTMRAAPSFAVSSASNFWWSSGTANTALTSIAQWGASVHDSLLIIGVSSSTAGYIRAGATTSAYVEYTAEL